MHSQSAICARQTQLETCLYIVDYIQLPDPALNRSLKYLNEYPRSNFDAPYFVTWFFTTWNILYLPIYLAIHFCCLRRQSKGGTDSNPTSLGSSAVSNNAFGSTSTTNKNDSFKENSNSDEGSTTSIKKVFA